VGIIFKTGRNARGRAGKKQAKARNARESKEPLPLALRPVLNMIPTYFILKSSSACGGSSPTFLIIQNRSQCKRQSRKQAKARNARESKEQKENQNPEAQVW
jgi:hypothetical protein